MPIDAAPAIVPDRLADWLTSDRPPQLAAVLTPWQYAHAHIPGSVWFPAVDEALAALRHDRPVVVYAPTDVCPAARFAERALRAHGFGAVARLCGGFQAWATHGHPVVEGVA